MASRGLLPHLALVIPTPDFARPEWLGLLLLLPIFAWLLQRSRVDLSPARRRLAGASRVTLVILLVLSLAGMRWMVPTDGVGVIVAVDASLSISEGALEAARASIGRAAGTMRDVDRLGIVLFGRDAWFEMSSGPSRAIPRFSTTLSRDRTDLARALRLAQATVAEGVQARVVLVSDGNENLGDAAAEASLAARRGIEIWTVPCRVERRRDVVVQRLDAPEAAHRDQPFDLRVHVRSTHATSAVLRLDRNGVAVGDVRAALHEGDNILLLRQRPDVAGTCAWRVRVEAAGDPVPFNNEGTAVTLVEGRPRILYVTGMGNRPGFLPSVLRGQGLDVDVVDARGFPQGTAGLAGYDCVVLASVPAYEMSPDQLQAVATATRDLGTGLVMLGGENSFAAGGYRDTPVEAVLPVSLDIRKVRHLPSVGLVLVLDKSGSMGETLGSGKATKIDLAREASIATLELLGPRDTLGVVAFDSAARWVVEPTRVTAPQVMVHQIASLRAGGGTAMFPAMLESLDALEKLDCAVKHMIVLTDGLTAPGNFSSILARAHKKRITISTVGVGADTDQAFLYELARDGRGRFYHTERANAVPAIFLRDTVLATRSALVEEPFVPVVERAHSIVKGFPGNGSPLRGYVVTAPRPGAQDLMVTHRRDPLLSVWRMGLGKAVAFTSDDGVRWADGWTAGDAGRILLVKAVRWALPELDSSSLRVSTQVRGERLCITAEARTGDGGYDNFARLEALLAGSEGKSHATSLEQTGPGRYEGTADVAGGGSYILRVRDASGGRARRVGLAVPGSPEFIQGEPDLLLLQRVASLTGGRFDAAPEQWFEPPLERARVPREAWPLMVVLALILLPLDVAARRVFLPAGWWRKMLAVVGSPWGRAGRAGPVAEGRTMQALKSRKQQMRNEQAEEIALGSPASPSPPRVELVPPADRDPAPSSPVPVLPPVPAGPPAPDPAPADTAAGGDGGTLQRLKQARRLRRGGDPSEGPGPPP